MLYRGVFVAAILMGISVANLATFSLDLVTFQTLLATLFLKSD